MLLLQRCSLAYCLLYEFAFVAHVSLIIRLADWRLIPVFSGPSQLTFFLIRYFPQKLINFSVASE